jgi:hypothetical protein
MERRPGSRPYPGPEHATPRDLRDLTPEVAENLLVETLLRIGLDLHAALALATDEPVRRQLRSAVLFVDEALRQVRMAAIERLDLPVEAEEEEPEEPPDQEDPDDP